MLIYARSTGNLRKQDRAVLKEKTPQTNKHTTEKEPNGREVWKTSREGR